MPMNGDARAVDSPLVHEIGPHGVSAALCDVRRGFAGIGVPDDHDGGLRVGAQPLSDVVEAGLVHVRDSRDVSRESTGDAGNRFGPTLRLDEPDRAVGRGGIPMIVRDADRDGGVHRRRGAREVERRARAGRSRGPRRVVHSNVSGSFGIGRGRADVHSFAREDLGAACGAGHRRRLVRSRLRDHFFFTATEQEAQPRRRFEVVLRVVDRVADLGADIATVHAQVDRWEKKTRKPSPPLNEKSEDSSPSSGQPSVDSVGKSKS